MAFSQISDTSRLSHTHTTHIHLTTLFACMCCCVPNTNVMAYTANVLLYFLVTMYIKQFSRCIALCVAMGSQQVNNKWLKLVIPQNEHSCFDFSVLTD